MYTRVYLPNEKVRIRSIERDSTLYIIVLKTSNDRMKQETYANEEAEEVEDDDQKMR